MKLGLPQGRGGRLTAQTDLTVEGFHRVYALGDMANIPDADGNAFPQLGSVALQAGQWAADNILADAAGKPRQPFHYKDKGIMAMIGSGAAVAEMGAHHRELHGHVASRLGSASTPGLMSGRARTASTPSSLGDGTSSDGAGRGAMLDDPEKARIDWGDDDGADTSSTAERLGRLAREAAPPDGLRRESLR